MKISFSIIAILLFITPLNSMENKNNTHNLSYSKPSEELTAFKFSLEKYEKIRNKSNFESLLIAFNKIKNEQEKIQAINIIQGILSIFPRDSKEFKDADNILKKHHEKQIQITQIYLEELKRNKNNILQKISEEKKENHFLKQENYDLKTIHQKLLCTYKSFENKYNHLKKNYDYIIDEINSMPDIDELESVNNKLLAQKKELLEKLNNIN